MAQRQRSKPTQQRAVAMRRALLDATVELLAAAEGAAGSVGSVGSVGSGRVTTTAIVARAHVSSGTFYRYFNDLPEILGVLRDEAVRAISDDLMGGVVRALELDLEPAMREIVVTLVDAFERHRPVILAIVNQMPAGHNANVLPEIEADLHQLATLLPRRHRPGLAPDRLAAVVFLTMGVLVSTCLRISLQRPAGVDRDDLIDLTTAMLVAGLPAS